MKTKILAILLCLSLILAAGCSIQVTTSKEEEKSEASEPVTSIESVAELVEKGYESHACVLGDGVMTLSYISPDHTDFLLVSVNATEAEYEEYCELDYAADDYQEQVAAFFDARKDSLTMQSLTGYIPSADTMEKYIGCPISDLEADGYEQWSLYSDEETGYIVLQYGNMDYVWDIRTEEDYEDMFSLPDNLSELIIREITFADFNDPFMFIPET